MALESLPKFGFLTRLESCEADLKSAREALAEMEKRVAGLEAENKFLRSQVFCFRNVKDDYRQLTFLSDLNIDMWCALWTFLKPSPTGVLSGRSAAKKQLVN